MPDDPAWAEPVVVPDDLRDLQADVEAYQRELRARRRAARWGWLTGSATWRRWSFPLGMVTGAVGLAALVFVLLAVESGPPPHRQVAATPLANPTTAAGQRGGLLPAVSLAAQPAGIPATALHSARDLRPGLVALVPLSCRCTDVLSALASEADEVRVPLHVVAPAEGDAEVSALPGQLPAVKVWFDAAGELARTYAAAGVTVLVVDPDGVVSFVQRQTTVSLAHTLPLQSMLVLPPSIRTR